MYALQSKPDFSIKTIHNKFQGNVNCFVFYCVICRELMRKEMESLQKMTAIAKEGFQLKQQLIQEAKRGLEDKKV